MCDELLFLRQKKNAPARMAITMTATPTPIPAWAPVERPDEALEVSGPRDVPCGPWFEGFVLDVDLSAACHRMSINGASTLYSDTTVVTILLEVP